MLLRMFTATMPKEIKGRAVSLKIILFFVRLCSLNKLWTANERLYNNVMISHAK
jgi:hypothetical protein